MSRENAGYFATRLLTLLLLVSLCGESPLVSQVKIDQKTRDAVKSGLDFLAREQTTLGAFKEGINRDNVAVVSIGGIAFLAQGSTPSQGRYAAATKRCLTFVLSKCQTNGFITNAGSQSHGPMYGHGFATLFLAEVYGTAPSEEVKKKLERAVKLIVETQNDEGGWRYQPQKNEADLSVTICQVMALRAAKNAGIHVPNKTIDACIEYVKKSQNQDGGFMYLMSGGESAFPRSAAGIVALFSAGIYEGKEIDNGLKYLIKQIPNKDQRIRPNHYFYGHYYAVQAMFQTGGEYWDKWYPAITDDLLSRQKTDGSWIDGVSPYYGTAMACIILQIPDEYLPIFQR